MKRLHKSTLPRIWLTIVVLLITFHAATSQENGDKASDLIKQLQSWATQHKAARVKAVEETKERLQAQGKVVTGAKAE